MTEASTARSVADRLAGLAAAVVGRELPVRLRAWDGSESGQATGPVLVLHNRRAARRLLSSPASGFAEAYIAGDVDIEGELAEALSALWTAWNGHAIRRCTPPARPPSLLGAAARLGVLGRRPRLPGAAAARHDQRHLSRLDPAAMAQHDGRSNLYDLLLDPAMVYCGGYFMDGPVGDLAAAQRAALDLICRKLGLGAGTRHLDMNCGWGSLICCAAERYGAHSTGVAHSRQQYEYVSKRIADAGLADRVQVRLADHRESTGADDGQFDAVSAIGLGQCVDDVDHAALDLQRVLRPGGRALVQQVSRGQKPLVGEAFLTTYIAPDLQVRPLATTVSRLAAAGLEVRDVHALREHYEWSFRAWAEALERSWNGAVDLIGEAGARAWRLYLVGGALAFAENRVRVDQILAVRPDPSGEVQSEPVRTV